MTRSPYRRAAMRSALLAAACAATCALLSGCNDAPWPPVTPTAPARVATPAPAQPTAQLPDTAPLPDAAQAAAPAQPAAAVAPVDPIVDPPKAPAEPLPMVDITFDTLKFDIEKDAPFKRSMLTTEIEALDGRTVTIRGYILPSYLQTGLTQFVLVRDNMECCFGPGALLYDCLVVEMKPGRSTDFSVRPVAVTGAFTIREMVDGEGKCVAIYHLDGDAVE